MHLCLWQILQCGFRHWQYFDSNVSERTRQNIFTSECHYFPLCCCFLPLFGPSAFKNGLAWSKQILPSLEWSFLDRFSAFRNFSKTVPLTKPIIVLLQLPHIILPKRATTFQREQKTVVVLEVYEVWGQQSIVSRISKRLLEVDLGLFSMEKGELGGAGAHVYRAGVSPSICIEWVFTE